MRHSFIFGFCHLSASWSFFNDLKTRLRLCYASNKTQLLLFDWPSLSEVCMEIFFNNHNQKLHAFSTSTLCRWINSCRCKWCSEEDDRWDSTDHRAWDPLEVGTISKTRPQNYFLFESENNAFELKVKMFVMRNKIFNSVRLWILSNAFFAIDN